MKAAPIYRKQLPDRGLELSCAGRRQKEQQPDGRPIITVANQKGGGGKNRPRAINLSAALAHRGKRTLLMISIRRAN